MNPPPTRTRRPDRLAALRGAGTRPATTALVVAAQPKLPPFQGD